MEIIRFQVGCIALLHSDGWIEILAPGDNSEHGKPHISIMVREVMGCIEIHTYGVRQRGACTYSCVQIDAEVNYQPIPIVRPLIDDKELLELDPVSMDEWSDM